jgi:hypothetical protein
MIVERMVQLKTNQSKGKITTNPWISISIRNTNRLINKTTILNLTEAMIAKLHKWQPIQTMKWSSLRSQTIPINRVTVSLDNHINTLMIHSPPLIPKSKIKLLKKTMITILKLSRKKKHKTISSPHNSSSSSRWFSKTQRGVSPTIKWIFKSTWLNSNLSSRKIKKRSLRHIR